MELKIWKIERRVEVIEMEDNSTEEEAKRTEEAKKGKRRGKEKRHNPPNYSTGL